MAVNELRIGIETELCLAPLTPDFSQPTTNKLDEELKAFAAQLVKAYNGTISGSSTPMRRVWGALDGEDSDPRYWSLMPDSTLQQPAGEKQVLTWPFELTSPILPCKHGSKWRNQIVSHYEVLEEYMELHFNDSCSTHIHVSPPPGAKWELEQAQNVAQSILYFEPAFEVLLPASRRSNIYAKSNRVDNPALQGLKSLGECFKKIQVCEDFDQLIWVMNAYSEGGKTFGDLELLPDEDKKETHRLYGWNFGNLTEHPIAKGTIGKSLQDNYSGQFRRGPASPNAEICIIWTDFATNFVQAAIEIGDALDPKEYTRDVAGLKKFMLEATVEGMNNVDSLKTIFLPKYKGATEPLPIPLSVEDRKKIADLNNEKKMKNDRMDKIRKLNQASK